MTFKQGVKLRVYSVSYPDGIVVICKSIARVPSGAVLAFCETESGRRLSFPVSKWDVYGIRKVELVEEQ